MSRKIITLALGLALAALAEARAEESATRAPTNETGGAFFLGLNAASGSDGTACASDGAEEPAPAQVSTDEPMTI